LDIMRELRVKLSSVATPTYAIDLPDGGGKIPLQPDYECDGLFEGIHGKFIPYYL
jgi:lysine 2,3-aminomutase